MRRPAKFSDEGFSLMEAVVACLVLALTATIVASMLINVLSVVKNTGSRTAAANLAASRIDAVRQLTAVEVPDGRTELPDQTVGNMTYSLRQDTSYQTDKNNAGSPCTGGGSLAYKRVTVTVTWPNMGTTKPVTTETLLALGFDAAHGGLDATKGAIAAYVLDEAGKPVSGAQVGLFTSAGGSAAALQTSGDDGCVVFTGLPTSTFYSRASKTSFVTVDGASTAADNGAGVVADAITKTTLTLGASSRFNPSLSLPAGAALPTSGLKWVLTSTIWPSVSTYRSPAACVSGANAVCQSGSIASPTFERVFPGAYGAWVGTCADARPVTPTRTAVSPKATATAAVQTSAVKLTTGPASLNAGKTITATHAPEIGNGCTAGETITLGAAPAAGGSVTIALPPGTWTLRSGTAVLVLQTFQTGVVSSVVI